MRGVLLMFWVMCLTWSRRIVMIQLPTWGDAEILRGAMLAVQPCPAVRIWVEFRP